MQGDEVLLMDPAPDRAPDDPILRPDGRPGETPSTFDGKVESHAKAYAASKAAVIQLSRSIY